MPAVDSAAFTASAFNTAASFTTNTNWQSYVPEVTMSYFTQMAGLAHHNFVSAAVGISLAIAFIRGIARRQMQTLGNFWVDLTRAVLLPHGPVASQEIIKQWGTNSSGFIRSNMRYFESAGNGPETKKGHRLGALAIFNADVSL